MPFLSTPSKYYFFCVLYYLHLKFLRKDQLEPCGLLDLCLRILNVYFSDESANKIQTLKLVNYNLTYVLYISVFSILKKYV